VTTSALDHLGFFVPAQADVALWHAWVEARGAALGASIVQAVKTHRDGATSFYARDPAGHLVQFLHMP
jgi:catechol 2,3-dioxygenase-like lactoylglutathione lyase family enzyme